MLESLGSGRCQSVASFVVSFGEVVDKVPEMFPFSQSRWVVESPHQ